MHASFHKFSFRGAGVMSCWRGVCRVCRGRTGPWFAEGICQSLEPCKHQNSAVRKPHIDRAPSGGPELVWDPSFESMK